MAYDSSLVQSMALLIDLDPDDVKQNASIWELLALPTVYNITLRLGGKLKGSVACPHIISQHHRSSSESHWILDVWIG